MGEGTGHFSPLLSLLFAPAMQANRNVQFCLGVNMSDSDLKLT